jgi:adenylyltransferase/sulfurtransferase
MSYITRIALNYSSVDFSREELAYYARHILLPSVGFAGQCKLKAARVLVVGAGGLGCPVLQALAGAGVGHLTVADADEVSVSNLSRQWLHRFADRGQNKAMSAGASLRELNPFIEVVAVPEMLHAENSYDLVQSHDLVVDATDDLAVRYLIDDVCAELDLPWVHAALYRESAQMTVFWHHYGASFRALYPIPSAAPSCSGAGIFGVCASMVGNLQALEVIKLITGSSRPQLGTLVSINFSDLSQQSFRLSNVRSPSVILPNSLPDIPKCAISVFELQQARSIHQALDLVDVRTLLDFERASISGARHVSAERILESGLSQTGSAKTVLICDTGWVSQILADALSRGTTSIYFLSGGMQAWEDERKVIS